MNIKSAKEKERGNGHFCSITLENTEFLKKKYDRTEFTAGELNNIIARHQESDTYKSPPVKLSLKIKRKNLFFIHVAILLWPWHFTVSERDCVSPEYFGLGRMNNGNTDWVDYLLRIESENVPLRRAWSELGNWKIQRITLSIHCIFRGIMCKGHSGDV